MDVKLMHRQGHSLRQIAQMTGLSRVTVRRILSAAAPKGYGPRAKRPGKLAAFVAWLEARLGERPRATASWLHRGLVAEGFGGSYTTVKRWAHARRREERAAPLLAEFCAWLGLPGTQALRKSPLGQAIVYATNQWPALTRYVEDRRLSLSNNAAERALRPFAIGRGNRLLFQREGGGETAAILMSLLLTAKAAAIDTRDYFRDVLLRLSNRTDMKQLMPHSWREHFAAEVAERRHALLQ